MKRLYRSESDRMLLGVCGGLAAYYNADPVLVRAGYAFITIISGLVPGVIAYFVLAWIVPTESKLKEMEKYGKKKR